MGEPLSYEAYMCLADFTVERGDAPSGNLFFSSITNFKEAHPCVEDCGIVKVRITEVEIVQPPSSDADPAGQIHDAAGLRNPGSKPMSKTVAEA